MQHKVSFFYRHFKGSLILCKGHGKPNISFRFHHLKSKGWYDVSQQLFCNKMDEEILSLNQSKEAYLDAITRQENSEEEQLKNLEQP